MAKAPRLRVVSVEQARRRFEEATEYIGGAAEEVYEFLDTVNRVDLGAETTDVQAQQRLRFALNSMWHALEHFRGLEFEEWLKLDAFELPRDLRPKKS